MSVNAFGDHGPQHEKLGTVLSAIASGVEDIAQLLRSGQTSGEVGTVNSFGDKQLEVDIAADDIIFNRLKQSCAVATASSEERPKEITVGGQGYAVAFDPLDGSSIVGANFSVGAIFGVWKGDKLLGRTGEEQAAAAYAVFGSRTSLIVALPDPGATTGKTVQEYTLIHQPEGSVWKLTRDNIKITEKKVFAPANLRAAAENTTYRNLISQFILENFTLRYTGGFVPDVHHILIKGGGIFLNPVSPSAPAKLRLLYECAPLAFVVEAAGGASSNGTESILQLSITSLDLRTPISIGSKEQVQKSLGCLA
ncbi:g7981 [Coccomyxa elongata]